MTTSRVDGTSRMATVAVSEASTDRFAPSTAVALTVSVMRSPGSPVTPMVKRHSSKTGVSPC